MINVLVTGAAGFIASNIINKLLKLGKYNIIGIDNLSDYYDVNLKLRNLGMNVCSNFEFMMADISIEQHMRNIYKSYKIDCVIHMAAQAGVSYSIEHSADVYKTNVIGFDNVARFACENGVKHIIYASSSSVYGDDGIMKSPYAVSKKTNELQAETYSALYKETKFTGLRFFTVYGINVRPDLAIPKFINAIKKDEELIVYGDGTQARDFTYVEDVAEAVVKIVESEDKWYNEVFDVGYGRPVSVNKLIEIIKDEINPNYSNIKYVNERPFDVKITRATTDKLRKWFGYTPKTIIEEGIKKCINQTTENQT